MSELILLCKTEDVQEGVPVAVEMEGLPALAVFNVSGEYFVTEDLCSHGNAKLSDGYQDGEVIECPFHGGAFCIKTGAASALPCVAPIRTYPVIIQDGRICISRQYRQS